MGYPNEVYGGLSDCEKLKMSQEAYGVNMQAQTCAVGVPRHYTLREEAEKSIAHLAEQHAKKVAAVEFFAKHPEFDEFIRLIRSGSIHI